MPERVSEDVLAAGLPGEEILLDMAQKRYFRLNATGQLIWRLLADGTSRAGVLRALVAQFDVAEEVADDELDRFLAELRRQGLIRPGDAVR